MLNRITIQNLKCGGCAATIKRKLEQLDGVSNVQVEVESDEVAFELDSNHLTDKVRESLKVMGYPSIDDENSLSAKAKSYVSCAVGRLSQH